MEEEIEIKLGDLLVDGVIFCNTLVYNNETLTVLYVNANDIFAWGRDDVQTFSTSDIDSIYDHNNADPEWGIVRWCCIKRNMQPQRMIKKAMTVAGSWDFVLDKLPLNPDSK